MYATSFAFSKYFSTERYNTTWLKKYSTERLKNGNIFIPLQRRNKIEKL